MNAALQAFRSRRVTPDIFLFATSRFIAFINVYTFLLLPMPVCEILPYKHIDLKARPLALVGRPAQYINS